MKRVAVSALLLSASLFLTPGLFAKDAPPRWTALQVQRFTMKPGLGMSQQDLDNAYQGLLEELRKGKPAEQILEDGTQVPPADAANSVVMEGTFLSYEAPHGFHGAALEIEIKLYRISDHRLVLTTDWNHGKLKVSSGHASTWRWVGENVAKEVMKGANDLPPLASLPPATPTAEQPGATPAEKQAPSSAPATPTSAAATVPTGPTIAHHAMPYRAAEVKRFTIAEGVPFPPNGMDPRPHLDSLYEHFVEDVQKQGIATNVVREGENVPEADAADALLIEGIIADFRRNGANIAHPPELTVQLNVYRRSDHALIATVTPTTKLLWGAVAKPKPFGSGIGSWTAKAIKKSLQCDGRTGC